MKAAVGTPNGLELRDIAEPQPKPHEVKVKVKAAGLNRADLSAARGAGGHGAVGATVGLEWAGEVVEAGAEVRDFKPGDRVMCGGSGGYAEYAVSDHGRTMRIPDGLDFKQAATLPVALNTMHDALVTNGRLKAGESVLIQGASSGVGLMGLQIAKLKGARLVMGSSTNDERRARLKEFGADLAIDTRDAAWPDQVLKATDGKGVNLIVDMVSGATVNPAMRSTALLGRIVNVGRLGGAKMEFDFDLHAMRRIDYIGVTFRTRTLEEIREIVRRMKDDLWDAVSARKLTLPIDRTFPLAQAVEAQAYMRANNHFGKIALTME
jgi:NADPH:quinone reductase-like Zn-dependent oxidoreductase